MQSYVWGEIQLKVQEGIFWRGIPAIVSVWYRAVTEPESPRIFPACSWQITCTSVSEWLQNLGGDGVCLVICFCVTLSPLTVCSRLHCLC
jgi:hypothetical protein